MTNGTKSNHDSIYEDSSWKALDFDSEDLSISKCIVARGQFGGSYMLGKIRVTKFIPAKIDRRVMMKSANEDDEVNSFNGMHSELDILQDLCHANVIQLIGYCSEVEDCVTRLTLVYEYCSNGNLIKILQKGRPYYNVGTYCPKKAINNEILSPGIFLNFCGWHLLHWATEIARGMEYLAFKGVVHGDLAARNVLITCGWTAKICNFGISTRHNYHEKTYARKLRKHVLPIAWMAPETIQNLTYSQYSDVWSYGVTLWEIYTLGDIPYNEDKYDIDPKFWMLLVQDVRPRHPMYANDQLWNLMQSCWKIEPESRPVFSKMKTFLERTCKATKEKWGSSSDLSGHDCSGGGKPKKVTPLEKKKHKKVTFAPHVTGGGVLRKCFYVADDILVKHGIKHKM